MLSDLHVDYPQNRARVPALVEALGRHEADAFVLAGDISHKLEHVEAVLEAFSDLRCPKLFVAGNHDVWIVKEGKEPVKDSWDKLARLGEVARRNDFVFLEHENAQVGEVTFVGSMGWYDYSFASPALDFGPTEYAAKKWGDLTYMDRDYARWGMTDAAVAARLEAGLELRLAEAKGPIVFVSHHVPTIDLVLRRGHASWDFFNAYMGTKSLQARLSKAGVSRFVFGHTHRPVTLIEPGRFVINNPLGYPRQALTPLTTPFTIT